ncbi:MAG: flagellar biosynthesis anti-sigma factor FlgM [Deltaproteobacteria bacterium]|nr:flagellar biosynthesis anti-sigma factor FlgM [Deltaproteobacteria bacterium]
MKINETPRDLSLLSGSAESFQNRKVEEHQEPAADAGEGRGQGAEVRISSTSIEFSRAAEMMETESPERAQRIKEIQEQIQQGAYRVDSARVAEKILSEILAG